MSIHLTLRFGATIVLAASFLGMTLPADTRKACVDRANATLDSDLRSAQNTYQDMLTKAKGHCDDCINGFSGKITGKRGCYQEASTSCGSDDNCLSQQYTLCDQQWGIADSCNDPANGTTICGNIYIGDKASAGAALTNLEQLARDGNNAAIAACPLAGSCTSSGDCIDGYDAGIYCVNSRCVPCGGGGYQCSSGQVCDTYTGKCVSAQSCDCPGEETCDDDGACVCVSYAGSRCNDDGCSVWACDGVTCDNSPCNPGGSGSGGCGGDGSCSSPSDCPAGDTCDDLCCVSTSSGGGGGGGFMDPCSSQADCDSNFICNGCGYCYNVHTLGCDGYYDPIAIDLSGAGYLMTRAEDGVRFDFYPGRPTRISWTARGANVGWLVIDLNGDGKIDNGTEMFSNLSPQPTAPGGRFGFRALAAYDQLANGGDRDGWITEKDAVFSRLRVWVDKNHNGKSEPNELLTLQQAGVKAISVSFTRSKWSDAYGNLFLNEGQIVWSQPQNGRSRTTIYDIILVEAAKAARRD